MHEYEGYPTTEHNLCSLARKYAHFSPLCSRFSHDRRENVWNVQLYDLCMSLCTWIPIFYTLKKNSRCLVAPTPTLVPSSGPEFPVLWRRGLWIGQPLGHSVGLSTTSSWGIHCFSCQRDYFCPSNAAYSIQNLRKCWSATRYCT